MMSATSLHHRQIVAWLQLAPGSRVLDAGCGGGGMTRLLAEAVGPDGEVVGLDANPQLLAWGQSQVKDTDLAGLLSKDTDAWFGATLYMEAT